MSSDTPQRIEFEGELSPSGEWPPDWLRSAIQDQLDEQDLTEQVDVDELASAVGERISTVDPSRVDDIDATVRAYEERLSALEAREPGGGTAPEGLVSDLEEMQGRVEKTRNELTVINAPKHTRTIIDGGHTDEGYHETTDGNGIGAWGVVVTADEDVSWREGVINSADSGSMLLEVYLMEYSEGEVYEVGEQVATREIDIDGGEQTIYPDIPFAKGGTYFITRDTANPTGDDVVRLKRGRPEADWEQYNNTEVPLTFECSWQLGRSGPGTSDFEKYQDSGWDQVLHHWANMEFGFMDPVE